MSALLGELQQEPTGIRAVRGPCPTRVSKTIPETSDTDYLKNLLKRTR
jgi:hypothetical protein